MKNELMKVIKYLNGKLDIYDGKHKEVINAWDDAWDEMLFLGYKPDDPASIQKYIKAEL